MRIGISVLAKKDQNIWSNGLNQNIYNLACLLEKIPFIEGVYLVNFGEPDASHPVGAEEFKQRFSVILPSAATDLLDVIIEMGGVVTTQWSNLFHNRGGKIVFHDCGNPYMGLIKTIHNDGAHFGDLKYYDEIWLLPRDEPLLGLVQAIHRKPVCIMPFIWSPMFIENSIKQFNGGSPFGYEKGSLTENGVKAAIFEPNMFPGKMGLIPLLICEQAERQEPDCVRHVDFLNGNQMADQTGFVFFMKNLSLYEKGRITIQGRNYFTATMGKGANLVISHQLDWDMNYLYFDAIYGNYPLIHNSPTFRDVGYFYDDSNIEAGVVALFHALKYHDDRLEDYKKKATKKLSQFLPDDKANVTAYARGLVRLTRGLRTNIEV